ncbi:MAG: S41 family peptidase [Gemmatimonadota bacterium]
MLRPRTAAVASLLLLPMVAGGFLLNTSPSKAPVDLFKSVLQIVSQRYVDTLAQDAIFEKAAKGLIRELNDPYSELLSPKLNEEFNRSVGGRYGGVGMLLEEQKANGLTRIVVQRVFHNSPAEANGVLEGDVITKVDTMSVTGDIKIDQVSNALRGPVGTTVNVQYARPTVTEPIKLSFTRAIIKVPAVPFSMIAADNIGYIPLQTFNENTSEEVTAAANELLKQGAKGLVLDLRDNGGGIVEQSLEVSSLFLKDGQPIVNVRGRNTVDEIARATSEHLATQLPLVILTDGGTASASEIVAGSLQDHDRALVLGTTSFGKGLVQSLFPLDGGYALKITTGKWYTPNGRSIHRERKLLADGRFVEVRPDSMETEAEKKAKPAYKSDAGRTVYGGGGITPDLIVPDDTLTTLEQEFYRVVVAPKAQAWFTTLNAYAFELKGAPKKFTVTPEWRAELRKRLTTAGVIIDPKFDAVSVKLLDNELDKRVARLVLGDAGAKIRGLSEDHQLSRAIALLSAARTQDALLASATVASAAKPVVKK